MALMAALWKQGCPVGLGNPPRFWMLQEWTLLIGIPDAFLPTSWLQPLAVGREQVLCKQGSQMKEKDVKWKEVEARFTEA